MHSLIFKACWAGLLLNLPRMLQEKAFSLAHLKQDERIVKLVMGTSGLMGVIAHRSDKASSPLERGG